MFGSRGVVLQPTNLMPNFTPPSNESQSSSTLGESGKFYEINQSGNLRIVGTNADATFRISYVSNEYAQYRDCLRHAAAAQSNPVFGSEDVSNLLEARTKSLLEALKFHTSEDLNEFMHVSVFSG